MSKPFNTVIFALAMCVICGSLLTGAYYVLNERQQKNIEIYRKENILKSAGIIDKEKKYSHNEILDLYKKNIRQINVDSKGKIKSYNHTINKEALLPLYLFEKKGQIKAYIIPINTKGLWGEIAGYIALKEDGETVSGFTVYRHAETPGLGGEIEQNWFQNNFIGKKIVDSGGLFVSITIAKGDVEKTISENKQENYVDGISGATLTGHYLTTGLKNILEQYEPVSICLRTKRKYCEINKNIPWDINEKK